MRHKDLPRSRRIRERIKIGRFEMLTTSEDSELEKHGLHEVTYQCGIVCYRDEPEYNETAFQEVYRQSTGRQFKDDINDLAAYCSGTVILLEEPVRDDDNEIVFMDKTTYMGVENEHQFKLAVEWLQERLLMYEMAEMGS